jgi:hypothetical protein
VECAVILIDLDFPKILHENSTILQNSSKLRQGFPKTSF